MIRWVYERARRALLVDEVWVATDDKRIQRAVECFGGNSRITSPEHPSGTDRLAEVARNTDWDIVINVQGDEPLIDPAMVDAVAECLRKDTSISMGTLKRPLRSAADLGNPNVVKVVTDKKGYALYFSRSPLPFFREGWKSLGDIEHILPSLPVFGHVGLYAYRRDFLLTFSSLSPTPLEKSEQLEQLRALEHGFKIKVETFEKDSFGVDTPEDLEKIRQIVRVQGLRCSSP